MAGALDLLNVNISQCEATERGGGISASPGASLVITASAFTRCRAGIGAVAAVCLANSGGASGGAIALHGARATIGGSYFEDTSAGCSGGVIACSLLSTLTIANATHIEAVFAQRGDGGALHVASGCEATCVS